MALPLLHLQLLGEFRLAYGDSPVSGVNLARVQSLLAYLVLHRHAPQSRQHIAFLFWPDSSEAQARANLRQRLHYLHQALPEADRFLLLTSKTMQWRSEAPFLCDVAEFERQLAVASAAEQAAHPAELRTALETAVQCYQGDLLPSCYDEWVLPLRERLREELLKSSERLIQLCEEQRAYAAAIDHSRSLLRHDPLHEPTYRSLMRLHLLNGDRASALRVYHACATVLERELGVTPNHDTQVAHERLLNMDGAAALPVVRLPTVSSARLIGRQAEWRRLQTAWRSAVQGSVHFVLLAGEAGIGKSRLAEEMLTWASQQGLTTVRTRAYAAEGELAYAPIIECLRSEALQTALARLDPVWLSEIARLLSELLIEHPDLPRPQPLTERWQRQRLFEALAWAFLSLKQPLLFVIDDLQWCDQETLEWLHYLLRFDARARLLVIGTMRPEDVDDQHPMTALLLDMRSASQVTEIELHPLNADETAALAAQVAERELDSDAAYHLFHVTEGNPLYVVETVRSRLGEWEIERLSDQAANLSASLLSHSLPPKVHAILQSRLAQLSTTAGELAHVAATIGRSFTFDVLARASELEENALVRGLDELWQRRIVREQTISTYDFSHDRIRDVAYARISPARRRLLHRRVAQALEQVYAVRLDAVSSQIAAHYEQAGLTELAIPWFQRAAEAAVQVYANAEAIHYYRRALDLQNESAESPQVRAAILYERLGDTQRLIGRLLEAQGAFQHALMSVRQDDQAGQARLHRKIGDVLSLDRRYEEALQAYELACAVLGVDPVETTDFLEAGHSVEWWQEWIDVQINTISAHYYLNQLVKIDILVEQIRPLVERYGTRLQRAAFLWGLWSMYIRRERYVVTEQTLEYSLLAYSTTQPEMVNPSGLAYGQFAVGFCRLWYGHLDKAEEWMQAALTLAERSGDVIPQSCCLSYLTLVYRKRGLVADVERYAERSLAVAAVAGEDVYLALARANQAWVAWSGQDLAAAEMHGLAALALWHQIPWGESIMPFQWTALWPLLAIALVQDQTSQAIEYARTLLVPSQQRLPDELTAFLEQAIYAWDNDESKTVGSFLQRALASAQHMRYL